jgi:hypothetical protein
MANAERLERRAESEVGSELSDGGLAAPMLNERWRETPPPAQPPAPPFLWLSANSRSEPSILSVGGVPPKVGAHCQEKCPLRLHDGCLPATVFSNSALA